MKNYWQHAHYIETYLASEGFLAYQDMQYTTGMRLVTSEHIFAEFVPFDESNFDDNGNIVKKPRNVDDT